VAADFKRRHPRVDVQIGANSTRAVESILALEADVGVLG
jgi:DNA-binding transcriptional LysR family regulator